MGEQWGDGEGSKSGTMIPVLVLQRKTVPAYFDVKMVGRPGRNDLSTSFKAVLTLTP